MKTYAQARKNLKNVLMERLPCTEETAHLIIEALKEFMVFNQRVFK